MNDDTIILRVPTTADEIFLGDLFDDHEREIASLKEDKNWYRWCYEVTFTELAELRVKHERLIYAHQDARNQIATLSTELKDRCVYS